MNNVNGSLTFLPGGRNGEEKGVTMAIWKHCCLITKGTMKLLPSQTRIENLLCPPGLRRQWENLLWPVHPGYYLLWSFLWSKLPSVSLIRELCGRDFRPGELVRGREFPFSFLSFRSPQKKQSAFVAHSCQQRESSFVMVKVQARAFEPYGWSSFTLFAPPCPLLSPWRSGIFFVCRGPSLSVFVAPSRKHYTALLSTSASAICCLPAMVMVHRG